jgi:hypothetical protein
MLENSRCCHYQESVQVRPQFHCCWREEIQMLNTCWRSAKTPCMGVYVFQVLIFNSTLFTRSQDSPVGIANGYRLDDRGFGVRVVVGSRIFSSPHLRDQFWWSPSILLNWYQGLFPQGQSGRGVKLATHLQLVPRSKKKKTWIYTSTPPTPSWHSA